ncbi:MAG: DMT family transporter [Neomegalonema sp.]|nr:DMT family transporter [Neomegalonema sp.]
MTKSVSAHRSPPFSRRERWRGHAALILFAMFISVSFSLGAVSAPMIDPSAMTAARFLTAAIVMVGGIVVGGLVSQRRAAPSFAALGRGTWRFLLLGAFYGAYFVCMFEALRLSPPTPLVAVFTLSPLLTAGLAYLLAGQRTPPSMLFALLLGGAGAVWVIFGGDIDALLAFKVGLGEGIFLLGTISHSIYAALVRRMKGPETLSIFTLGVILGAMIVVTLAGFPAVLRTDWTALPAIVWATIFYTGIAATVGSATLLQYAALRLPASKVMAYTYLPPSLVILIEGALGNGWASAAILPGVAATVAALALLSLGRDDM